MKELRVKGQRKKNKIKQKTTTITKNKTNKIKQRKNKKNYIQYQKIIW